MCLCECIWCVYIMDECFVFVVTRICGMCCVLVVCGELSNRSCRCLRLINGHPSVHAWWWWTKVSFWWGWEDGWGYDSGRDLVQVTSREQALGNYRVNILMSRTQYIWFNIYANICIYQLHWRNKHILYMLIRTLLLSSIYSNLAATTSWYILPTIIYICSDTNFLRNIWFLIKST